MAHRTWYRMKLKKSPVAGCCFLFALSVVTLTGFSPAPLSSYKESDFQFLPRNEPLEKAARAKRMWKNSTVSVARQAWRFSHRKWPGPQGRLNLSSPGSFCKQKSKLSTQGGQNLQELKARRKNSRQIRKPNTVTKGPECRRKFQPKHHPSQTNHSKRREYDAPFSLNHAGKERSFSPPTIGKEVDGKPQRQLAPLAHPLQEAEPGALLFHKNASGGQLAVPQEQCKPDVQPAGAQHQPSDLIKAFISDRQSSQTVTGTWMQMRNAHSAHPHFWTRDPEELQKSNWCKEPQGNGHPGKQEGKLRFGEKSLPWFTPEDVEKMKLLTNGTVVSKDRIPGHGQILRVTLSNQGVLSHDPSSLCLDGLCGLIKRTTDLYEVLAFHLDRVLGLHRSLPVVARKFSSHLLPYKYTDGATRPIVWWAPDIQHLNDSNNDQNSFALGWQQYQDLLRQRCGMKDSGTSLGKAPCLTVLHSEWAKLALFDFLLQVHDRLDRYCCGFQPDPSEPCVQEMLHEKCGNPTELLLVHILIRKTKPSHLVFIDNAGRPLHPDAKLNFRMLEGIDGFPATALTILKSGCLQNLLLQSLYVDEEFWETHGGEKGVQDWVQAIDRRGQILLQYIQERNLTAVEDSTL
ncbi:Golgi-associated kinase 1A [Varanus komodoensis]|nr:Golgi-associated kinase 1A [Varanus komodoensis]